MVNQNGVGTIVTITTAPQGRQVTVDGSAFTSPTSFTCSAGSTHTLGVASPQGGGDTRYLFTGWSDGGQQTHSISCPSAATTYTASFKTQYSLTTAVQPTSAGTMTASPLSTLGDGYYDSGTSVQLTAVATAGRQFANWSGDLSGSTNPQSIVLTAPRSVTANFTQCGAPLPYSYLSTIPAAGGDFTVQVADGATCKWTVSVDASWILFPNGTAGQGQGSFTYRASPNPTSTSRTANFTVVDSQVTSAATTFGVIQVGASTVLTTITTVPAGLAITVDGSAMLAPASLSWTAGSSHSIGVTSPQGGGATRSVFASWSDGGGQTHAITVPTTATTYMASFKTQYLLTTGVQPTGVGMVTASPPAALGDGYYDSGTSVQLTASPTGQFANWSGDLSGSANPQTIVMNAAHSVTANFGSAITINTTPAGLQIVVDGSAMTAPQSFSWAAGSSHTISVSSPQGGGGTRYVFTNWSDGGGQTHTISAPSAATTYTASFKTQYLLTTAVVPAGAGTVRASPLSALGDGYYDSGTSVQLTAVATGGSQFANWVGDLSGLANPQSIVMTAPRSVTANFTQCGAPLPYSYVSNIPAAGGDFTVQVADGTTCKWTVSVDASWISFPNGTSGQGQGSFTYRASSNQTSTSRTANFTLVDSQITSAAAAFGVIQVGASTILTTITTAPAGLAITVDGSAMLAPASFSWTTGGNHTISVSSPQGGGGTRSVFTSWSDGGAQAHTITVPTTATTYTASFKTQYLLTTGVVPVGAATVTASPSSLSGDGYYDSGTSVQLTASPEVQFANWSGDLSGPINPQTILMNAPHSLTANFVASQNVAITTMSISDGLLGVVYPTTTLAALGGTPPYIWTATGAPSWLTVSSGGVLSGTPSGAVGPFQVAVTATDSSTPTKQQDTRTFGGNISQVIALLSVSQQELDFSYVQGDANGPGQQSVGVFTNPPGASVPTSAVTSTGGNWLSITPSFNQGRTPGIIAVSVNPAGLIPATYIGQITITPPKESNVTPSTATVKIVLIVSAAAPPQLSITPSLQNFARVQGSQAAQGQLTVLNTGGGSLQFRAQASSDANWLAVTGNGSGVATASSPGSVGFSIDPGQGLPVGLHRGQITVTDTVSAGQATSNVNLLVNAAQQTMQLSQAGMTFTAVSSGASPTPPAQSATVFNLGQGSMAWTTQAQTIPSGQTWLHVSPPGGVSSPGSPGPVTLSVDPTGLALGQFYGWVDVVAPNAANTLQSLSVLLNVVPSGQLGTNPKVSPGGVILTGAEGSTTSVSQDLNLFNPNGTSLSYSANAFTVDGGSWLTVSPAAGSFSQSGKLTVQANLTSIPAAVRYGTVQVAFSEGTIQTIHVALIATSGNAGTGLSGRTPLGSMVFIPMATTGCQPTQVVPVFIAPQQSQTVQVGKPQTLQVKMLDDCSNPVTKQNGGAAQVTFSNKDQQVDLTDTGGGIWEGTWVPANAQLGVTLQVVAREAGPGLGVLGGTTVQVLVLPANTDAAPQPGGAVNSASYDPSNANLVVPGSYVAIFGARLADGTNGPVTPPLFTLGNTQMLLARQPLPLSFAIPGQVNGLIPQKAAVQSSLQLLIQRDGTLSSPLTVTVTDLQPGIFTMQQNGQGQGAILVNPTSLVAGPVGQGARPAKRGEYIEIYCTGLGQVIGTQGEKPLDDGMPAPASGSPLYETVATASVTIGGVPAPVVFAGLAPSFVALYQVNALVSADAPTGDTVQVVLTMTSKDGRQVSSPAGVTIAVQ